MSYNVPSYAWNAVNAPAVTGPTIRIIKSGINYEAINCVTGNVDSSNTDPTLVIQYAINNVGSKGKILIDAGIYTLTAALTTKPNIHIIGAGNQNTTLKAAANLPAIVVSNSFVVLEDLFLVHNQFNYTSSVLQLQSGAAQGYYKNLFFYDFTTFKGNAIEFLNELAANSYAGQYSNFFHRINIEGFQNAIKFTMTNQNNFIQAIFFHQGFFDSCQKIVACSGPATGSANTNVDRITFTDCVGQYEAGNPLTVGFDFTDTSTHNYTVFTNTIVYDLPEGSTFMNVGTQTADYTLLGCIPVTSSYIGGSGASSAKILKVGQNQTTLPLDSSTTFTTNRTGSKSAALGSNGPMVTATAPYTWIQATSADGSIVYIPAWK